MHTLSLKMIAIIIKNENRHFSKYCVYNNGGNPAMRNHIPAIKHFKNQNTLPVVKKQYQYAIRCAGIRAGQITFSKRGLQ